ncbi:phosphofructokinase [Rhodococcus ruber]|uniref:1-phosphofructokinase family hexose kinase n=1 Tax=Rhodococcus TaxID=1827 RepID=UPI00029ABD5B|nr:MULTISPECIES: 1-phosphofructokinase family hexose kinase [Rhodococcus]ATQ27784.1 phosphofructokinase [Rhodococcus ruber]
MPDIVTVTMNPALDMTTYTEQVRPTSKLRCEAPRLEAGGGGINVAKVAGVLGVSAAAVYPAGGPTGDMLSALLSGGGVDSRRIDIDGMTRESFTAIERSTGQEYRFVLPGPELSVRDQERCLDMLVETATGARYVVASGSLPPGVPGEFVQRVADAATDAGARFVLDSSGDALRRIKSGVHLVKPSLRELREWVGRELRTPHEQAAAAHELVDAGIAEVVVVSLGPDGALLVSADTTARVKALDVPVRSAVGAGDSMVAGLVVGLLRGRSLRDAMALGIAAGSAALLTPGSQVCRREDVERFDVLARER